MMILKFNMDCFIGDQTYEKQNLALQCSIKIFFKKIRTVTQDLYSEVPPSTELHLEPYHLRF